MLHIREGEPEDTLPLVRQGAVDLALAYHFDGPLPVGPGPSSSVEWTPLLEDPCTSSCRKGTDSPTAMRSTSPSWQQNPGCSAA